MYFYGCTGSRARPPDDTDRRRRHPIRASQICQNQAVVSASKELPSLQVRTSRSLLFLLRSFPHPSLPSPPLALSFLHFSFVHFIRSTDLPPSRVVSVVVRGLRLASPPDQHQHAQVVRSSYSQQPGATTAQRKEVSRCLPVCLLEWDATS